MSERGLELGTFCSRERYLNRSATAQEVSLVNSKIPTGPTPGTGLYRKFSTKKFNKKNLLLYQEREDRNANNSSFLSRTMKLHKNLH